MRRFASLVKPGHPPTVIRAVRVIIRVARSPQAYKKRDRILVYCAGKTVVRRPGTVMAGCRPGEFRPMRVHVADLDFAAMRAAMVSNQLRTNAVNDARVVEAMRAVPREAYVPADQMAFAYADRVVPLGGGRRLNLPMATGRMLTEALPRPRDRALVVGAAGGYAAALLARLVAQVVALEEDAALPALARVVAPANVTPVSGPLADGWAAGAPYDLILIDGVVEQIPDAIVDQLAEGGRLVAGLSDRGVSRLVIGRRAGGGFGTVAFADVEGVVLPGFAKPAVFSF